MFFVVVGLGFFLRFCALYGDFAISSGPVPDTEVPPSVPKYNLGDALCSGMS